MSFRGRYPTRFRRSGGFPRSKRSFYGDKDDSFQIEKVSPLFRGGRGTKDRFYRRDSESDFLNSGRGRGRGRRFPRHFGGPDVRSFRSRHPRGRHGSHEGCDRSVGSPEHFEYRYPKRFSEDKHGSPNEWSEEEEFLELSDQEGSYTRQIRSPMERFEEEEFLDKRKRFIGRRSTSPVSVHRSLDRSHERSFENSKSPVHLRRSSPLSMLIRSPHQNRSRSPFSIRSRSPPFSRSKSPVFVKSRSPSRMCSRSPLLMQMKSPVSMRSRSPPIRRSRSPLPMWSGVNDFQFYRGKSFDGSITLDRPRTFEGNRDFSVGHRAFIRTDSPERFRRYERKHSRERVLERSLSPLERPTYYDEKRRFKGSERDRSVDRLSISSIERQIRYERRRKQMLEHQKRCHEKRSESSIERFLDDCKKSIERKLGSPHLSHRSSYERKSNELPECARSFERSLSPEQSRTFKGLDRITIRRGRSFGRSESPISERREKFYLRSVSQNSLDFIERRSMSSERRKKDTVLSREGSCGVRSTFSSKSHSKGLEIHISNDEFLKRDTSIPREPKFGIHNSKNNSQYQTFKEQKERGLSSTSYSFKRGTFSREERSYPKTESPPSPILQMGDNETKELLEPEKKSPEDMDLSPISKPESFENNEFSPDQKKSYRRRLDLSPISQPGSFEKREFSGSCDANELQLSPISQPGSFEKREFSRENRSLRKMSSLSSISPTQNDLIERPNSADSMQQFLAELEESCERSCDGRSSSYGKDEGRCFGQNVSSEPYKVVPDEYGLKKNYLYDKEKIKQPLSSSTIAHKQVGRKPPDDKVVILQEGTASLGKAPSNYNNKNNFSIFNQSSSEKEEQRFDAYVKLWGTQPTGPKIEQRTKEEALQPSNQFEKVQDNFHIGRPVQSILFQGLNEQSMFPQIPERPNLKPLHLGPPGDQHRSTSSYQPHGRVLILPQTHNQNDFLNQNLNITHHGMENVSQNMSSQMIKGSGGMHTHFQNVPNRHDPAISFGHQQFQQNFSDSYYNVPFVSHSNQSVPFIESSVRPTHNTNALSFPAGVNQNMQQFAGPDQNKPFPEGIHQQGPARLNQSAPQNPQFQPVMMRPNLLEPVQHRFEPPNQNMSLNSSTRINQTVPIINKPSFRPNSNLHYQQALGEPNRGPQYHKISERPNESVPFSYNRGPNQDVPLNQRFDSQSPQFQQVSERPNRITSSLINQGDERSSHLTAHFQQSLERDNRSIHFNRGLEGSHNNPQFQHPSEKPYQSAQFQQMPIMVNKNLKFDRPLPNPQWPNTNANSGFGFSAGSNQDKEQSSCASTELSSCVDLKKYLAGTFGSNYRSVLNLDEKEVIVISDDEANNSISCALKNVDPVFPDPVFVERFRNNPPSPEEIGKMLEGFVIYFGVKENSDLEKDPLLVIQESFLRSVKFGRLDVEETSEYKEFQPVPKKVCTLRWRGVMLARAEAYSQEEARFKAGVSLINSLAHTCYTVQTKYSYYCGGKLPKFMLKTLEKPGIYKVVSQEEIIDTVKETLQALKAQKYWLNKGVDATHIRVVLGIIEDFFNDANTHCELIFGGKGAMEYTMGERQEIAKFVDDRHWLRWRTIQGYGRGIYIAVCRMFSPQSLCRYLLRQGGDNLRYRLLPPQGPWVELLKSDGQYSPNVVKTISQKPEAGPSRQDQPSAIGQERPKSWAQGSLNRGSFKRSRPPRGGGGGGKRGKWNS